MQVHNLQIAPNGVKPIVHLSQFDVGRQFQLKLYDGSIAYIPPVDTAMYIEGIKPDDRGFSYGSSDGAISFSGNTVTITTLEQMTIVAGTVKCEIRLVLNSNNIGTLNFDMIVEESPVNETTDISETDLPEIFALATEQMKDAEAWAKGTKNGVPVDSSAPQYQHNSKYYAESIGAYSRDSEAWAVGTRDGQAVTSEDETYHNNSKYWNEQTNLDGEAWTKGTRNGTPVGSEDETYHNNSKYYATQSANSATLSQSWAVGNTGGSRSGEDTNNSKYWSEESNRLGQYWANVADQTGLLHEKNAEAWAVGERGGYPVSSDDPTYKNNSKYYSGVSHDTYEECLEVLSQVNAYFAIIKMIMGRVGIITEFDDYLVTEDGKQLIVDY